ncbi:MAG: Cys-Cys-COOH (seleno)protein SaoC [Candidatus Avilachnospira sp.]|jgi:hypothetical protein
MRKNESEEKKISLSYILIRALIVLAALIVAFLLNRFLLEKEAEQKSSGRGFVYDPMVPEDNKTLVDFKAAYPDRRVVMACENDVTDDGIADLLVIYKEDHEHEGRKEEITRLVVCIVQEDGSYVYTEPIPAPIENQGIQFKNIDREGEMEFIVAGEKNGKAGYAIYRMIDGVPTDLFGDGMEDCC